MTDTLFQEIVSSNIKIAEIADRVEDLHFNRKEESDLLILKVNDYLTRLSADSNIKFCVALCDFVSEFWDVKCNINSYKKNEEIDENVNNTISIIIDFLKRPNNKFVFNRYPDVSLYSFRKGIDCWYLIYDDPTNVVGTLMYKYKITKNKKDCKTRGKLGSKFWWVNDLNGTHYYLFHLLEFNSEESKKYYDKLRKMVFI